MKTTLQIQNLKCGGCEKTIINKLNSLKNISNVTVDQVNLSVAFQFVVNKDIDIVKKILSKLGYPIIGEKNNLSKKAVSYVSCAIGKMQ